MSTDKKKNYIVDAWLVILLALLYGVGLAAVQSSLGPKIVENQKNETFAQIPELVPGSVKSEAVKVKLGNDDATVYRALDANGKTLGWVIPGATQGFADQILYLIGTDADVSKITGLFILSQKETPGLGDFITRDYFRDQFKGLSTDQPIGVSKTAASGNDIKALTGATISSTSVASGINDTLARAKPAIKAL